VVDGKFPCQPRIGIILRRRKEDEQPKAPEDGVDRLAIKISLFVLCVALFLAAYWMMRAPSFPKCSALEKVTERNTCYDKLRDDLLKPPVR
jgi:hypothetical protein